MYDYPPKFFPQKDMLSKEGLAGYTSLFTERKMHLWLINSFKVAAITTAVCVFLGASAAYSISRFRFRGRAAISYTFLGMQFLPGVLIVVPLFVIFAKLKLINTHTSLIIASASYLAPLATWILRAFFDSIPVELEHAALVDGCNQFGALWRIVAPLALPGFVGVGMVCFVLSWDSFLFAYTFLSSDTMWTVPVGISSLFGEYFFSWPQVMAAATMAALPAVVVFIVFQRFLIQGLTAGAVKG